MGRTSNALLLVLAACVCAAFATAVGTEDMATKRDTLSLDEDFSPEMQRELRQLRMEHKHRGSPEFQVPTYTDQVLKSNHMSPIETVTALLEDESEVEHKAELLSGLHHVPSPQSPRRQRLRRQQQTAARDTVQHQASRMRFAEARSTTKLPPTEPQLNKRSYLMAQGQLLARKLHGRAPKTEAQWFEDCMACRLVWRQVEMDVANARFVEDVEASFERNCMDLQKSQIFYKGCEDMYDDMWAMVDDYMSSEYTVDKMCVRAHMCKAIPLPGQ
jgi:hypothetical protein